MIRWMEAALGGKFFFDSELIGSIWTKEISPRGTMMHNVWIYSFFNVSMHMDMYVYIYTVHQVIWQIRLPFIDQCFKASWELVPCTNAPTGKEIAWLGCMSCAMLRSLCLWNYGVFRIWLFTCLGSLEMGEGHNIQSGASLVDFPEILLVHPGLAQVHQHLCSKLFVKKHK